MNNSLPKQKEKKSGRSLQSATSEKVAQTNLENVSGLVEQHPMSVIQKNNDSVVGDFTLKVKLPGILSQYCIANTVFM